MNLRSSRLVHGFALRFCSCLWSCVTPVVLLVMFVAILVERCVKPITYLAWNSSSVSAAPPGQGPAVPSGLKHLLV